MKGRKPEIRIARDALADAPAPDWISETARQIWADVVRDLSGRKILTTDNLPTVANYCVAMAAVREGEADVRENGRVIDLWAEAKDGTLYRKGRVPNPAVKQMNDAMSLALRLAAELGATPISRSRPALPDDDGQDDLFDFDLEDTCYGQTGSTRPN